MSITKHEADQAVKAVKRACGAVTYRLERAGQRKWYEGREMKERNGSKWSDPVYRVPSPEERIQVLREAEAWAAEAEARAFRARQLVRDYRRKVEKQRAEQLERINA